MGFIRPYPSPCLTCKRDFCRDKKCEAWKTRYLYRQKQINAVAKMYGLTVGVKENVKDGE